MPYTTGAKLKKKKRCLSIYKNTNYLPSSIYEKSDLFLRRTKIMIWQKLRKVYFREPANYILDTFFYLHCDFKLFLQQIHFFILLSVHYLLSINN